jgi:hypothetical protein
MESFPWQRMKNYSRKIIPIYHTEASKQPARRKSRWKRPTRGSNPKCVGEAIEVVAKIYSMRN